MSYTQLGGAADLDTIPPGAVAEIQIADRDQGAYCCPYIPMGRRFLAGVRDLPLTQWLERSSDADFGVQVFSSAIRSKPGAAAVRLSGEGLHAALSRGDR